MHRLIQMVVLLMALACALPIARSANAEMAPGEHMNAGLGFHNVEAPVGVRWWFPGQKVGVDLGFGYSSEPSDLFDDESLSSWAIDAGVPFVIHSWERVHVILRPGVLYRSRQVESTVPPAEFDTEDFTTMDLAAEIEGELFLADNFSVSASHGIGWRSINPPGDGDNITSFTTLGRNFTSVGFHVYFFGGSQ